MEGVRVRVQFEDPRILRKCQRKEGLQQSWVMLRPRHKTISDLSDHLLQVFKLQESCPRGLILSMDGFVLPPFETTSVLTDKDVVWVKRKVKNFTGTARLCDEKNPLKALEIADTQPVDTKFQLLAKEDFVKETGGYGSEPEEDEDEPFSDNANEGADAKKRKASRKLKSPKRKKSRLTNAEESQATSEDAGNDAAMKAILKDSQLDNDKISHNKVKNDVASTSTNAREPSRIEKSAPKKKARKSPEACGDAGNKKPATKLDRHQDDTVSLEDNQLEKDEYSHKVKNNLANATETDNKITVSSQSLSQEKGKGNVDASPIPSEIKRFPSRSARRKKLKRQWQREMRKIGEKEGGQRAQYSGENNSSQEFLNNNEQTLTSQEDHRRSGEQQLHQSQTVTASNDTRNQQFHLDKQSNDMIVPIEIRPGHIRFEPLDEDADQQLQKTSVPVTTFQWNGVTDKKKGQKWGKERAATKWTDKGYQKTKWTDDDSNKTNWTYNNYQKTEWTVADSQNTAWNDSNHKEPEWNKNQNINLEPSHQVSQGKETHPSDSTDFTKLSPYGTVPQEGDVVAYRLIELSSSWTPEISPFRVRFPFEKLFNLIQLVSW
ncbi:hypothetical protein SAY86_024037 [Trapa natans]|uniref:Coilin n=1 Tax=Trapa natans TaxID=22666 RepID=A0AAN7LVU4_TRANT|nr:hypothetical protein SAY86_024037 [Trapa natans]